MAAQKSTDWKKGKSGRSSGCKAGLPLYFVVWAKLGKIQEKSGEKLRKRMKKVVDIYKAF